jgi:hypothetical protein
MKLALLLLLAGGDAGFSFSSLSYAPSRTSFVWSAGDYFEEPIEKADVSCAGQNATLDAGLLTCSIYINCANHAEPRLERRDAGHISRSFLVCDARKDGGR